jgi:hypothetical protein
LYYVKTLFYFLPGEKLQVDEGRVGFCCTCRYKGLEPGFVTPEGPMVRQPSIKPGRLFIGAVQVDFPDTAFSALPEVQYGLGLSQVARVHTDRNIRQPFLQGFEPEGLSIFRQEAVSIAFLPAFDEMSQLINLHFLLRLYRMEYKVVYQGAQDSDELFMVPVQPVRQVGRVGKAAPAADYSVQVPLQFQLDRSVIYEK